MNLSTLDIRKNDIVLDIGSGNDPKPVSTILLDLFITDNSHRSFNPIKMDWRPFIHGGVENLPFKNKSVDYIICNHVLEHVDDPLRACLEIQRVAKRGYIECPSPFLEQGYYIVSNGESYWNKHKWYVWNPSQSPYAAERREISKLLIFQRINHKQYCNCRFAHIIQQFYYDMRAHKQQFIEKFGAHSASNIVDRVLGLFTPSIHHTIMHWSDSFDVLVLD